jgi:outer membrane receptor protein involved in Fe transport
MGYFRVFSFFAICALLVGVPASAQGTGTIHGVITDPSGGAIAGAQVTATLSGRGTTRNVISDVQGAYVMPLLPVGAWQISIEAKGFKSFVQHGVDLASNENVRVDANLQVGSLNEAVTVTAEATLVDSRSSVMGTLIDSRRVLELPMNGRSIIGLAILLPGASQVSAPQTFTGDRSGPTVSMSGSKGAQNLFLFDGAPFNALFRNTGLNYPPPDALQEVKVLTNSFSAEYGRNAGSVFNVVARSGSNEVHGSLWEFLRNQNLNARNFFAGPTKPQLIQNQFGGAGGGPMRKDKLFIFGSYEALRIRTSSLLTSAFPLTAAERAGDFSSVRTAIRNPLTGQAFPNNQIPASQIDPVARNLLAGDLIPLPNSPGGQLITVAANPQNNHNALLRLDDNWRKHTINGHYNYSLATQDAVVGNVPTYFPASQRSQVQNVTLADTTTIRPNLLNQINLSLNRVDSSITSLNRTSLADLGSNLPHFGPRQPSGITVTSRLSMGSGSGGDALLINQSFAVKEGVQWTRQEHSISAGFELLKLRYLNRGSFLTNGVFTFDGSISGNAAADFVLGKASTMQVASPWLEQAGLQTNLSFYLQDDWRIRPRLTLNLGLRYELPYPWVQPNNYWGTLHPGEQSQIFKNAPLGMVFPGDPGVPRGLIQTDKNNFAPRFGFAWDPFGHGRTSVRGAYGIFYEALNANLIQNDSQPYRYSYTFQTPFSLADPLRGQPTIPLTVNLNNPPFVGTQQVFYPDPGLRSGYVQSFNLNAQHEVVKDLLVQVGYMGKLGRKLLVVTSANPAVYGPGATLTNIDQRRILKGFGNNSVLSSRGVTSYNALQLDVKKRFSRGFSVQGAYTFSKSMDLNSSISEGNIGGNIYNVRSSFAPSDFNAKHIASFSWIWDLSQPHVTPVLKAVVGGWQMNGLVSLRSGFPVNVVTGSDVALTGTPNQRPNVSGNPVLSTDRPRAAQILAWFDRAPFTLPAAGTFGNVGRNALVGPNSAVTNFGLFKSFALPGREGLRLQFRSEFFNVFNSVNLGSPNGTFGSTMGRITSAGDPRVIQFALKLLF